MRDKPGLRGPDAALVGPWLNSSFTPELLRTTSARSSRLIELAELIGHSDLSQVRKYDLSDAERARAMGPCAFRAETLCLSGQVPLSPVSVVSRG